MTKTVNSRKAKIEEQLNNAIESKREVQNRIDALRKALRAEEDKYTERKRIGTDIRALREGFGVNGKELAEMIGMDAGNLCRIENGKYSVGFDILTSIVKVFGYHLEIVKD